GTTWLGTVAWQRPGCGRWPYPGYEPSTRPSPRPLPRGRGRMTKRRDETRAKTRCAGCVPAAAMDGRGSEYAHGCATERPGHTRCSAAPSEVRRPLFGDHAFVMRTCSATYPTFLTMHGYGKRAEDPAPSPNPAPHPVPLPSPSPADAAVRRRANAPPHPARERP